VKALPTQARVQELLAYDPLTGVFTWRVRPALNMRAGDAAGGPLGDYWAIRIDGRKYLAHRLAWLYVRGEWPTAQIDHRNGDGRDNRLANLREATQAQNNQNVRARRDNVSRLVGVGFRKDSGKWQARITVQRTRHVLGVFNTPEEAAAAYGEAKARLHQFQPAVRGVA
jgi:hypothetical protein